MTTKSEIRDAIDNFSKEELDSHDSKNGIYIELTSHMDNLSRIILKSPDKLPSICFAASEIGKQTSIRARSTILKLLLNQLAYIDKIDLATAAKDFLDCVTPNHGNSNLDKYDFFDVILGSTKFIIENKPEALKRFLNLSLKDFQADFLSTDCNYDPLLERCAKQGQAKAILALYAKGVRPQVMKSMYNPSKVDVSNLIKIQRAASTPHALMALTVMCQSIHIDKRHFLHIAMDNKRYLDYLTEEYAIALMPTLRYYNKNKLLKFDPLSYIESCPDWQKPIILENLA